MQGIYRIINNINNKVYIGSSKNIPKRKYNHFSNLKRNVHENYILQNDYNKYGKENFKFEIIEHCSKELLIEREQYYLDTLNPEYNLCKRADSSLGIKRSNEFKIKLKHARTNTKHSSLTKEKISNSNKNKKFSKEHVEKIRQSNKNRKHSFKTKKKISISLQKPVIQLSLNGEFINEFKSIKDAGEKLNISRASISLCCQYTAGIRKKNIQKTAGNFIWKYK